MKAKTKKKITTRTAAFLVMALLLLLSAAVVGAKTVADIQSAEYRAEFELSNLDVSLVENGTEVSDLNHVLLTPLEGKYKPGYIYTEEITARNHGDINMFLRINLRKYWADEEGNKVTFLDPEMIELKYNGTEDCGPDWQINEDETTTERTTYYYTKLLKGRIDGENGQGEETSPVVNTLKINGDITKKENIKLVTSETEKDGVTTTTYKYEYLYNGYWACIEANVQALQNHNAQDAVESLWGLSEDDITVTTDGEASGSLKLK